MSPVMKKHWVRVNQIRMNEIFVCTLCSKSFNGKVNLERHVIYHKEKDNRETCSICPKSYLNKGNLGIHMRSCHTNSARFKCDRCENYIIVHNATGHSLQVPISKDICSCTLIEKSLNVSSVGKFQHELQI